MATFPCYLISRDDSGVHADFASLSEDQLDPGGVVVRIGYASVNYKDALAATGKGKIIRRFPCIGGIDATGVVVSSEDARFSAGDPVIVHSHGFGVSHHGGYAALARIPGDWVSRIPDELTPLQAITIGVAGYTAALAIDLMMLNGLAPSQGEVLVNGATGGVASVAIDILSQRGFHVVAVTGKPAQADYLRQLGAAEVVASEDLPSADRPLESARWAGAIDSLGGAPLGALTRTMAKDGIIASIGNAAGLELNTTVMPFILRGVRLIGVNSDNDPPLRAHVWRRLATDLRPRHLERIANLRPFSDLPQVMRSVVDGQNRGRNVIEIDPTTHRNGTP